MSAGVDRSSFDPELLRDETETVLLGSLSDYPRIIAHAAELREPHRIARYLEELAVSFTGGMTRVASYRSVTIRSPISIAPGYG